MYAILIKRANILYTALLHPYTHLTVHSNEPSRYRYVYRAKQLLFTIFNVIFW